MAAPVLEAAPARLVHKLAADEVLLAGWRRVGEAEFRVATRWPREHGYYFAADGHADPMLLIETLRQCLPLLSHAAFGAPLATHLVWESFGLRLSPEALAAGRPLDEVEIEARCLDLRRRAGGPADLTLSFAVRRHDVELASARTHFYIQAPAVYRRLRGEAVHLSSAELRPAILPAPVCAAAVGRGASRDVLLSATDRPDVWQLRVETTHPIYFDHPVDHLPGAALLDAAMQAARAAAADDPRGPVTVTAIAGDFTAFVELDETCLVHARRLPAAEPGHEQVRVDFTQRSATPVFSALVTTRFPVAGGAA